ncbi:MAG TPA: permease-like cell division protein FtsX [Chitinophagaceae bacterium]|nr:permease-like cell division protein FtsX [Chitinophagaceae bacterium]HNU14851.1 permease-like cell division protein FtsX [Chitinophagaceae bacterium]
MSQSGKASIKRGKPSYFMSILGVTLVLFFLGIIGLIVINTSKLSDHFKENVTVSAYLRGDLNPKDSAALVAYISSQPYIREYTYVTKEVAKKKYLADGNKDWGEILTENPLPNSIDFKVKNQYLNTDSLAAIKADLKNQTYVSDVDYPEALIGKMSTNLRNISIGILILAVVLSIVVIVLIDNTIKLAMFSNRFLIKTMQMVGATRWFIAKPMNVRAIINGAISGVIAAIAVILFLFVIEKFIPEMKAIHDNTSLVLLFSGLIILGVCITLFSTHRSVIKYLKMKLDDLY